MSTAVWVPTCPEAQRRQHRRPGLPAVCFHFDNDGSAWASKYSAFGPELHRTTNYTFSDCTQSACCIGVFILNSYGCAYCYIIYIIFIFIFRLGSGRGTPARSLQPASDASSVSPRNVWAGFASPGGPPSPPSLPLPSSPPSPCHALATIPMKVFWRTSEAQPPPHALHGDWKGLAKRPQPVFLTYPDALA